MEEKDNMKTNEVKSEVSGKKTNNSWVWWLVGCLGIIIIVVIVGLIFAWRAASGLVQNIDQISNEFENTINEDSMDYLFEDENNSSEEENDLSDLDEMIGSEDLTGTLNELEELTKLIEAGDWEAIEKMGEDLEKGIE